MPRNMFSTRRNTKNGPSFICSTPICFSWSFHQVVSCSIDCTLLSRKNWISEHINANCWYKNEQLNEKYHFNQNLAEYQYILTKYKKVSRWIWKCQFMIKQKAIAEFYCKATTIYKVFLDNLPAKLLQIHNDYFFHILYSCHLLVLSFHLCHKHSKIEGSILPSKNSKTISSHRKLQGSYITPWFESKSTLKNWKC